MKKIILGLVMSLSLLSAWEYGNVVRVIDGDTVIIKDKNSVEFKARLIGVDTFETKINDRAYYQLQTLKMLHYKENKTIKDVLKLGNDATLYSNKKLFQKVEFYRYGKDKYDRELVYVSGLNYMLVRLGLALYYPNNQMHKVRKDFLLEASKEANLEKRGIYEK